MRRQNILNIILFVIFFGVGLGAVYISFICDELIRHFDNRRFLAEEEKTLTALQTLISDYEFSLEQIKTDPNYIGRLGPTVLGIEREDSNTLYPQLTDEQLEKAKRVLAETSGEQSGDISTPKWLLRCNEKINRWLLGFSGACLVIISLTWFVWVNVADKNIK